jgi:flavodoxin
MKKIILMLAVMLMAASCTQSKAPKYLVLYYSETGNTKAVAQEISSRLGADIEEVTLVEPYEGTFQEINARYAKERQPGMLPKLNPLTHDIKDYDVIFVGYPIWSSTHAIPAASLFNYVDFSGKKVVPFCTYNRGGLENSIKDIKTEIPAAEVLPGYGVRASRLDAMPAEIDHFLKEGGFLEGDYVKYDDFSGLQPVTEEESAIFDAAMADYRMAQTKALNVASRAVIGGTEYLFEGEATGRDNAARPIKVYVLKEDGKQPVYTRVEM